MELTKQNHDKQTNQHNNLSHLWRGNDSRHFLFKMKKNLFVTGFYILVVGYTKAEEATLNDKPAPHHNLLYK